MKALWSNLLKITSFRKAILAHLHADYFHEFNHSISLEDDYRAYLCENDAYDSFSEIFIQQEYSDFIPDENILTILDIGANYGYFSLWLQSKRSQKKIHSTLIEPSIRCRRSLEKLVKLPRLQNRFQYLQRAVGDPEKQNIKFFDRPFMAGSIFESDHKEASYPAKTLKASDVFSSKSNTYDLIKCDIEGGEWNFLIHYASILKNSKFLVMEWHSWHSGGRGFPQIEKQLTEIGFQIIKSSPPLKAVGRDGEVGLFLAKNLNFQT
jgi:FkbM family methyltransferase